MMTEIVKCANCKSEIEPSEYMRLAWAIMKDEPACSRECRVALDAKKQEAPKWNKPR